MARRAGRTAAPDAPGVSPSNAPPLVRLGILAALVLPFFLFSTASSEALRESKLLSQALGASLALLGLAFGGTLPSPVRGRAARAAVLALLAALALAVLSGLVNANVVDPLVAAALLPPLALFYAGASDAGAAVAPLAASALMASGAFTGALAAVQRWTGFFGMPLEAPEPRFLAAGLIGNAGDVGMALVVPSVLLFAAAVRPGLPPRRRALVTAALALAQLGLLATESVGPAIAFGSGAALYCALDVRRRRLPLVLLLAAACLSPFTGVGRRFFGKLGELRRGDVAAATTQRDIGLYAAREMIRERPFFGAGPGAFSNRFVAARVAAEERTRRRLVHTSGSAHFDNAHCEPATLAAEIGVAGALAATGAGLALLAGLFARREGDAPGLAPEVSAGALFAALSAVALLGLADFPLRIAVASGPAAFFAGVALRRAAGDGERPAAPSRLARALALAAGVLAASLAAVRSVATLEQARGESLLQDAATAPEGAAAERAELLSTAGDHLARAVALRPRSATALLALGSVAALQGEREAAYALYAQSRRLEERAESDLNLGRSALALGRAEEARALFTRAVWVQPRLLEALPRGERDAVAADVAAADAALPRGGRAPKSSLPAAR